MEIDAWSVVERRGDGDGGVGEAGAKLIHCEIWLLFPSLSSSSRQTVNGAALSRE